MQDQGILIVPSFGIIAEVIGTGDNDAFIDDDHFMVHPVPVAIQEHVNAVLQEVGVLATFIAERLGFVENPGHNDTFAGAIQDGLGEIIIREGISHKQNFILGMLDQFDQAQNYVIILENGLLIPDSIHVLWRFFPIMGDQFQYLEL